MHPSDSAPSSSANSSAQRTWRRSHLQNDRVVLKATLPTAFAQLLEHKAARLDLSRAALVAVAVALLDQASDDEIELQARLLERIHGIRFRRPTDSVGGSR